MSISVILTTYNRAPLLATTLQQLARGDFEPGDEVIVVDNASTDETPDVIAAAAQRFRVPLVALRETRPGKTPALNRGIEASRGDVLALTDDDVLVADDWVATIRQLFADPALDLAGGRVDPLWERPAPRWLELGAGERYGNMASPLALLHYGEAQPLGARTAVGANLVVRRRVHDAIGGFAPHLGRRRGTLMCGEDHDFCQRAVAGGYRCEYRPELRVRHHVPVARASLRYYVRWFFWSGVTNAMLEEIETAPTQNGSLAGYFVRQLAGASLAGLRHLARGRQPAAASELMTFAFASGYLAARARRLALAVRFGRPAVQKT